MILSYNYISFFFVWGMGVAGCYNHMKKAIKTKEYLLSSQSLVFRFSGMAL